MKNALDKFKAFVADAPVIAGDTDLDNKDPNKTVTLSAEELDVALKCVLTKEQYLAAKN